MYKWMILLLAIVAVGTLLVIVMVIWLTKRKSRKTPPVVHKTGYTTPPREL